jgi:DNA polymerase I-like protein with 3'-5' exonuclease and polymerase domains
VRWSFDIETTKLDAYRGAKPFSYSMCSPQGQSFYNDNPADIQTKVLKPKVELVCHNYHYEYSVLKECGYNIPTDIDWHDTQIEHQLLFNLAPKHSLDYVADTLCKDVKLRKYWREIDEQIDKARKIYGSYDLIPKDIMHPYQINDAERTTLIDSVLWPMIKEDQGMLKSYHDEIEVVKVTYKFESYGMMVDFNECEK